MEGFDEQLPGDEEERQIIEPPEFDVERPPEEPVFGHIDEGAAPAGNEAADDEEDEPQARAQPRDHPDYNRVSFARRGPNTRLCKEALSQLLKLPPNSFSLTSRFYFENADYRLPHENFAARQITSRQEYSRTRIAILTTETVEGIKSAFHDSPLWSRRVCYAGGVKQIQDPVTFPPPHELKCTFIISRASFNSVCEQRSISLVLLHLPTDRGGEHCPLQVDFKLGHASLDKTAMIGYIKAIKADLETMPRGVYEPAWPEDDGTLLRPGVDIVRATMTVLCVRGSVGGTAYSESALRLFEAELSRVSRPKYAREDWSPTIHLQVTFLGKLHQFFRMVRMLSLPDRPADLDNDYNVSPLFDLAINPNREWACPPPPAAPPITTPLQLLNYILDVDQPSISAIIGGPGTGKTTVIVQMIMERLADNPNVRGDDQRRLRFAIFTPSNAAANVVYEKFQQANRAIRDRNRRLVVRRLGEVSKFTEQIRRAEDEAREAWELNRPRDVNPARHSAQFITDADVYVSTAGSAHSPIFTSIRHVLQNAVTIIDEAGQGNELELLMPLHATNLRHLILVGDGAQLGPTIVSQQLRKYPLEATSLFCRLMRQLHPGLTIRLNPQFRMRPMVAHIVASLAYAPGHLVTPEWQDLRPHLNPRGLNLPPFMLFSSVGWREVRERGSMSYGNPGEAHFAMLLLRSALVQCGFDLETRTFREGGHRTRMHFGLISLYRNQVGALNRMVEQSQLNNSEVLKITVGTVDSMQGHAFDVSIVSSVRASNDHQIGFAHVINRLNVAISRAATLFLLAHFPTFSLEPGWSAIIGMADQYGLLEINADDYSQESLVGRLEEARRDNEDRNFIPRPI